MGSFPENSCPRIHSYVVDPIAIAPTSAMKVSYLSGPRGSCLRVKSHSSDRSGPAMKPSSVVAV